MVGPQAKRQAVDVLREERGLGVTRACGLIGISRSLDRYRRRPDPSALAARLRCLTIVDDCTRECLAIEVDTSLTGKRVVAVLGRLLDCRSPPVSITVDHGPEFEGQALDTWAYQHDIRLAFIRPGKPVENAYIESFNGKFRDECLNEHWFVTMDHAQRVIEKWRAEDNDEPPHSSLADLTPNEYARRLAGSAEQRVSLAADSTWEPD